MRPQAVEQRVHRQWLCWRCGRHLGEYEEPVALVRIRCKGCGEWNELSTVKDAA